MDPACSSGACCNLDDDPGHGLSSRRVVAVSVDPNTTAASEVMTPNPTTVLTEDSAMEALGIMLGRHFRHLPVREN